MFTHPSVPGSPPLSRTPIFVGNQGSITLFPAILQGGKQDGRDPPRLATVHKHSSVSHYCSRVVTKWLGAAAVTPRRRDALPTTTARGLPGAGLGRGQQQGWAWQQPPRRWAGSL